MPGDHDSGYEYLFADPAMIRDLLTGFVPHEWVADADFYAADCVNGSYVIDDLRAREDDMVWRLRLHGQWFYVYLPREFHLRLDPWMALRMFVYIGLLYQDLVAQEKLGPDARLPAVLPNVLYNGQRVWQAPDRPEALQTPSPPSLAPFRVQARYLLLGKRGQTPFSTRLRCTPKRPFGRAMRNPRSQGGGFFRPLDAPHGAASHPTAARSAASQTMAFVGPSPDSDDSYPIWQIPGSAAPAYGVLMPTDHDSGYKYPFADPAMMRALLTKKGKGVRPLFHPEISLGADRLRLSCWRDDNRAGHPFYLGATPETGKVCPFRV